MNKEILEYVKDNDWELRHSVDALSYAAIKTANPLISKSMRGCPSD